MTNNWGRHSNIDFGHKITNVLPSERVSIFVFLMIYTQLVQRFEKHIMANTFRCQIYFVTCISTDKPYFERVTLEHVFQIRQWKIENHLFIWLYTISLDSLSSESDTFLFDKHFEIFVICDLFTNNYLSLDD